jgi:hypothetical protein
MEARDAELLRDHLVGVELELVEVVEQQHRAEAQGWIREAENLQGTIDALHVELIRSADAVTALVGRGSPGR